MKVCGNLWKVVLVSAAVCGTFVQSHSWIACTDYTEKNGADWNPNKCRGFPRNSEEKCPKTGVFGLDKGYDHIPNNENACGEKNRVYTDSHPMAVYYPGQQVVLVHPMKNHGADSGCGNIWIPDYGSWIYRTGGPPKQSDPTLEGFKQNPVFDLGRSPRGSDFGTDPSLSSKYPKPGYGNAPKFCANTDKAMGTYSFNVPRNLRAGTYTFMWLWSFNSENNMYSTCFEVEIAANKATRDAKLRAKGFNDLTEPCGGLTSNPDVMGNSNPGCTKQAQVTYAATAGNSSPPPATQETPDVESPTESVGFTPYPFWLGLTTPSAQPPSGENPVSGYHRPPKPHSIHMSVNVHMSSQQFSGEMRLPVARDRTIRRYVSADFTCDVITASFWNAMTISDMEESLKSRHFDIMQQGSEEIKTNRVFYHVTFDDACDLSMHPPVVRLTREDLM